MRPVDKVPPVASTSDSYEIHVSQGSRWSLAEVIYVPEQAVARAQEIAAEPGVGAARVVWSRFDPATDIFTERTIFNTSRRTTPEGNAPAMAGAPAVAGAPPSPYE